MVEIKRGVFIAFEGIDGCGKSTQIKKFVEYLFEKNKHNHIILTRNPYRDMNIRAILREDDNPLTKADKLAELFIADRKIQAEEIIIPFLEKGHFIVTDRYKLSTLTYQNAQGIEMKELIKKHEGLPVPDITFVVDVPAIIASERMKKDAIKRNEHKFEKNMEFLEEVRQNYHIAKKLLEGENIFIVDGTKNIEEVFKEIKIIFEKICINLPDR
jgi:dTMP kinase